MEFSCPPSTSPYVTAPTSPSCYTVQYYHSAPASPGKRIGSDCGLTLNDFEFETCNEDDESWGEKRRDRGGEMAFADELFSNGHVMPLKLPPRLQYEHRGIKLCTSPRPITCSTISPTAMVKSPFARRHVDPFLVAMQKVMKEENSISNHNHRRTRSAQNLEWTIKEMRKEIHPNTRNPIESKAKGASYGRWVLHHSMTIGPNPKGSNSKPTSNGVAQNSNEEVLFVQTKMQKFKGMLLRYATFGKENNQGNMINPISALWKPNYFKKLSFKFKGSKKVSGGETNLVIVKYKPALCLGYGLESPRKM